MSIYPRQPNSLQSCFGTWLEGNKLGTSTGHPSTQCTQHSQHQHKNKGTNSSKRAETQGKRLCSHSHKPLSWIDLQAELERPKGKRLCRNSKQWDVPPQPSYEHLFQRTAVFYKADLKIGIFLLLREFVHFIFLLAKLLLFLYILASPAEPLQHWGGEPESILA